MYILCIHLSTLLHNSDDNTSMSGVADAVSTEGCELPIQRVFTGVQLVPALRMHSLFCCQPLLKD